MAVTECLEDIFSEIGFGRWQGLVFLATLLSQVSIPAQQLGSTLLSAPVPFRCSNPDTTNITRYEEAFLVYEEDTVVYPSQCLSVVNRVERSDVLPTNEAVVILNTRTHDTGLASCPQVEYDTSTFQSTVITEWDLICENAVLRPFFQVAFSLGALMGSSYSGLLSDWLGRKRTLQLGGLLMLSSMAVIAVVPWYSLVLCMRVINGMGSMVFYFPAFTLLTETTSSRSRTSISMVPGMTYFITLAAFAGFAYVLPDWRMLMLLCTSPLLVLVPVSFRVDESPRWLLQRGRATEAVDILRRAAAQNKINLSSSASALLDKLSQMSKDVIMGKFGGGEVGKGSDKDAVKNQGAFQMLRTCFSSPGMRTIMIVMPLLWLLQRCQYMGIALNANNFTSSNPFQYVAISGAMGLVATVASLPLSLKFSRRVFVGGTLSAAGIVMLMELAVPSDFWLARWIMVMASFCLSCGAFQINYVFNAELFPTVIRTRGLSYTNLIGSAGEMMIPFVTEVVAQYQAWAPNVTFGLAGIVSGVIMPLLPETFARPMPETFQDIEDRYWYDYKGFGKEDVVQKESVESKDSSKRKSATQV